MLGQSVRASDDKSRPGRVAKPWHDGFRSAAPVLMIERTWERAAYTKALDRLLRDLRVGKV
jgi:hypothetical protein